MVKKYFKNHKKNPIEVLFLEKFQRLYFSYPTVPKLEQYDIYKVNCSENEIYWLDVTVKIA